MTQDIDFQEFNLFTIGHGRRTSNEFITLLLQYDIKIIADVRTIPYSRYNPQFRRAQLTLDLDRSGIGYIFMGEELGGRPNNPNLYKNGKLQHSAIITTSAFEKGISIVTDLINQNIKVALMCSESNPDDCHRKHLLAEEFTKKGIIIWHIGKTGDLEKHSRAIEKRLFE